MILTISLPNYKGAVAYVTAPLLFVESKNKKHVQQISLKIRNFQWICDAHAFLLFDYMSNS